jgi:hypothetical protein
MNSEAKLGTDQPSKIASQHGEERKILKILVSNCLVFFVADYPEI